MSSTHPTQPVNDSRIAADAADQAGGIMVVDDDPVVLNLLQVWLPRLGFNVWSADGGHAGLVTYERHRDRIDLVLLDIRMPVLDGPATLRELRRLDGNVTCCFMTGHSGLYTPDALRDLGAVAVFEKPFDFAELDRSLRRIVGEARLRRTGCESWLGYSI
jgi:DNA-binding NtrC family response regulator